MMYKILLGCFLYSTYCGALPTAIVSSDMPTISLSIPDEPITAAPEQEVQPAQALLPSAAQGRETTVPNQFSWEITGKSSLPNSIYANSSILNTASVTEPHVIVGFKNDTQIEPAYQLSIMYSIPNGFYSIYIVKQGTNGLLGNCNITQTTFPLIWNALEQWRNGQETSFVFSYLQGTITLCISDIFAWSWSDTTPLQNINSIALSSIQNPIQFTPLIANSGAPSAAAANTSQYIPFNSANPLTLTFKSDSLPSTIRCAFYKQGGEGPQYILTLDTTNGTVTTVTHTKQPTNTSALLNSNGSYSLQSALTPSAQQTYFLTYTPSTQGAIIAFGLIATSGNQQAPQTLMYWRNPLASEQPCNVIELNSSSALNTITLNNQVGSVQINPPVISPLDIQNQGTNYTITGMNNSAAYKDQSGAWLYPLSFPQADSGAITFTAQITNTLKVENNGIVVLFGAQATGRPVYGVSLEPDTDQPRHFGAVATRARMRVFSFNTAGKPEYFPSIVTIPAHTIGRQYQLIYKKTNNAATITLCQVSNNSPTVLGSVSIDNAVSNITTATLSSACTTVQYTNVSVGAAPQQLTLASSGSPSAAFNLNTLTTVALTEADSFNFNWNHSALQQIVDLTNGFSVQATVALNGAEGDKTIAIGLSPSPVDVANKFYFNTGGSTTTTAFSGATQLILMTIQQNALQFMRFLPSPAGTTSANVSQKVVQTSLPSSTFTLWINYVKSATTYTASLGINSAVGTNPLFSWTDSRSGGSPELAKFCFGTWGSAVTFSGIQVNPVTQLAADTLTNDTIPSTPGTDSTTSTATPGVTPGTVTKTVTDTTTTYNWAIGQSSINPNGIIDSKAGGMLTALVQINSVPTNNTANIMVGLTSNTASTASAQSNGVPLFPSAEYNIQLQATAATGSVGLRAATTTGHSPYDGAKSVEGFKPLMQKATGASATAPYSTNLLWVRYTPSANARLFEAGLLPETASAESAKTAPALWSYTETPVASTKNPIQYMSINSLLTGVTITQVTVTPFASTATTSGETEAITIDGTIDSNNQPITTQWTNTAALRQIAPNSTHKITTQGANMTSRAVIAFQRPSVAATTTTPAVAAPATALFKIVLTGSGCAIYDENNVKQAETTQASDGGLSPSGTNYWFSITNGTLNFGGYAANLSMLTTPYVSWKNDILSGTTLWTMVTGTTSDASIVYIGSTGSSSATAINRSTLPAIVRGSAAEHNSGFRGIGATPAAGTSTAQGTNTPLSSQEQDQARYRLNRRRSAQSAA